MSGGEIPEGLAAALTDRYRIVGTLGRGATATVYVAEDVKHGRQVAIKVLDPELARAIGPERFRREIETAARLSHPNLMPLFDSGEAAGLLYYVMPHIPGESLRARLTREPKLPLDDALRIAREVADGLGHAHEHGLVHRDVKPENILLSSGHALLADFGISRSLRAGEDEARATVVAGATTLGGLSIGTPLYMAPEQFSAAARVDGRADIYSLGCVLYEMLAGEPPFTGSDVQSIQARHALDPVPPLRTRRPGVPDAVEQAIGHALAKVPADRPADARRFADELTLAQRAAPAAVASPAPAARRRGRGRFVTAGLIALGLLAVGGVAWRAGWLARLGPGLGIAPAPAGERRWVLLAAFDGPHDDPSLAVVARDLVSAAIDESGFYASVPPDQLRSALRLAGRPDTTRVAGDLARELAFRSSIRVVVEGTVHRIGAGTSTVLRAVDAETGEPIVTLTETAADAQDLVPSLGRLAARLRSALGERKEALAQTRPLVEAATPSFEAYKAYLEATALINAGDPERARRRYRDALALDPGFALAWTGLATTFGNRGMSDSARWALDQAEQHGHRLSEVRRLDTAAKRARLDFDLAGALAAYERALALDPTPADRAVMENNRGTILDIAGRLEAALAAYEASARVAPIEPSQTSLSNQVDILLALRRVPEARAMLPRLRGIPLGSAAFRVAVLDDDWNMADSVSRAGSEDLTRRPGERAFHLTARTGVLVRRGQWARADEALVAAEQLARQGESPGVMDLVVWPRFVLADLRGRSLPAVPAGPVRALQAFFTGLEGDSGRVRADARRFAGEFRADLRPEFLAMVEGFLALRDERWAEAIQGLVPAARGSRSGGWVYDRIRNRARWSLATAFEWTGQPDSAATYLGLVLAPGRWSEGTILERPLYEPFVRGRLVRLALARGRVDEARAQWDELQRGVTQPDAEARRFLDETRDAIAMAGGLRPRERR